MINGIGKTRVAAPEIGLLLAQADSPARSRQSSQGHMLVVWLSLVGVLLPPRELSIDAGINLTPGRLCMILLFFPAVFAAFGKGRKALWSDFFAFATAAWIVVAAVYLKGAEALASAAGAESIEFFGAYLVGRAFLWKPLALRNFLQALKTLIIVLVVFALADRISGRWIIQETLASLTHTVPPGANYREGVVRAIATLDHPILLGTFLSLASAFLIFSGGNALFRALYVMGCLFGCFLSLSSVAMMSWMLIVGSYFYDEALKNFPWRWGLFFALLSSLVGVIFLVANAPLGWLITHITLDPESGYFRYLIWDAALARIPDSPLVGFAFNSLNDGILDVTVDSVWLAYALRFGIPMIAFLFLANLTAIWPSLRRRGATKPNFLMAQMSTALTVVLVMFMFIGLTVHFWNFMWIFWGLCLGMKVSLKQQLT